LSRIINLNIVMDIKLRVEDLNSGLAKCVVNSRVDPIICPVNETADGVG